jgi:hypothetical protein
MKKLNVVLMITLSVFLVIMVIPRLGLADVIYKCTNRLTHQTRTLCGSHCTGMESAIPTTTLCGQYCGNGICDGTETCSTCPQDCGVCAPACGDGICNGTETCSTCPQDCSACAPPTNAQVVHGHIDMNGNIVQGTGFTVTVLSPGVYAVLFSPPFSSAPDCTALTHALHWEVLGEATPFIVTTDLGVSHPDHITFYTFLPVESTTHIIQYWVPSYAEFSFICVR